MGKSALRVLILIGLCKVGLCVRYGKNHFIRQAKTWSEARKYCREQYTDLSSISSQKEETSIRKEGPILNVWGWIGLYKGANAAWRWSGGKTASYFRWSQPENRNEEGTCVVLTEDGWRKRNCEEQFYFYCFRSTLILVENNKTWEEALEYCRHHHTNLASLAGPSGLIKALQTSRLVQADHVWTGLRYLADSWLWVNGDNMRYQAWGKGKKPQCPTWSHRCGALSLKGQHWDSRDCAEKLKFVCY